MSGAPFDARAAIAVKRDGGELEPERLTAFIEGYVAGDVPDYMTSALLMAIFVHGMTPAELEPWTRAMLESGDRYTFDLDRPCVDKHSTGGVGDKVSLPLAPALAACGVAVPMISGRGLGHTGGTLDKLEAIPGFSTGLDREEFERVLRATGVALGGQTETLVPADRKLYALRDVTGLVASIPLIASSILSKKLAEGIDALVLDVKYGSGAFLPDPERGAQLAETMIELAERFGLPAICLQTAMDRPLGRKIGHTLEVDESLDCLRGGGPEDLRELVCALGGEALAAVGRANDPGDGACAIEASLEDGSALSVFERIIEEQGGDPRVVEDGSLMPRVDDVDHVVAQRAGRVVVRDVSALGLAVTDLGGGRRLLTEAVDHGPGLELLRVQGGEVAAGEPLVAVYHRSGKGLEAARERIQSAIEVADEAPADPLILRRFPSA